MKNRLKSLDYVESLANKQIDKEKKRAHLEGVGVLTNEEYLETFMTQADKFSSDL